MKNSCIRILAIIFLGVSSLSILAAEQSINNTAYAERHTGLIFPFRIGLLTFLQTEEFPSEGTDVGIKYMCPGMGLDFYVYNSGLRSIPSNPKAAIVKEMFELAISAIWEQSREGKKSNPVLVRQEVVPLTDGAGAPMARHAYLTFIQNGRQYCSHLYLLGYKNHFVKIRFSYEDDIKSIGEEQVRILTKWLSDAIQGSNPPPVRLSISEGFSWASSP
jgi:hypothetical protein